LLKGSAAAASETRHARIPRTCREIDMVFMI
jgi:hypothetical protein